MLASDYTRTAVKRHLGVLLGYSLVFGKWQIRPPSTHSQHPNRRGIALIPTNNISPYDRVSPRVLIVDDERIVADSLALILRGRGYDCRAVYSGEDAAELAVIWKPDVAITDVVMGPMDGVALAIFLAQALPSCKVLLISGNIATEQLIKDATEQGHSFPILAKPFHPDRIFEFLGPLGTMD